MTNNNWNNNEVNSVKVCILKLIDDYNITIRMAIQPKNVIIANPEIKNKTITF